MIPRSGDRAEIAVLVRPDVGGLDGMLDAGAVVAGLDVAQCGAACDAVRAFVRGADAEHFKIERVATDDYILPAEDTWDVVAARLTPAERAGLRERTVTIVVRARGADERAASPRPHVALRAALAVASSIATKLSGLVYDETLRRIERAEDLAARAIRVPLATSAFDPSQIVVQSYAESTSQLEGARADGPTRLLTLGMSRFGAPDLTMRGIERTSGDAAANLLNAAAAVMADGAVRLPLTVTPADLARVTHGEPAGSAITLDAFKPDRTAGDPDNVLLELMPPDGGWDAAIATLTGARGRVVDRADDAVLATIARRARETLPDARAQAARDAGTLYVKGPFAYDGGSEWMWIEARACDAVGCRGVLTNDPAHATSLRKGADAGVRANDLADWLLVLPDGGSVGGASIAELEKR